MLRPTPLRQDEHRLKAYRRCAFGLLAALAARELTAAPAPSDRFELTFDVDAALESATVSASLAAGARLEMVQQREADGSRSLVLVEPRTPAWKLYAVDALGPLGDEAKLAAEVTLGAPSWEALAEARGSVDALALEQHRRLRARQSGVRPLDGAFAFIILGPPAGRFRLRIGPDGAVRAVENRLTHRWMPGEFGSHIDAWSRALREGRRPAEGYWFWNHGEREPFAWEPHVYHALEVALRLFEEPLPWSRDGRLEATEARLDGLADRGRAVLETLAPKARPSLRGGGPITVHYQTSALDADHLEIRGRAHERLDELTLELERRAVWSARESAIENDSVLVRLTRDRSRLEVRIAYHALET